MRPTSRPVVDQLSRDRIEDLGLIKLDIFIKRHRNNVEEEQE